MKKVTKLEKSIEEQIAQYGEKLLFPKPNTTATMQRTAAIQTIHIGVPHGDRSPGTRLPCSSCTCS